MEKPSKAWHAEILEVIEKSAAPVSAYDVLAEMRSFNPKMAPPTVYRALASLTELGHIHRLESMNAYVACQCESHSKAAVLSICDDCGTVEENVAPELLSNLTSIVGETGFSAKRHVIEVHGVCESCTPEGSA